MIYQDPFLATVELDRARIHQLENQKKDTKEAIGSALRDLGDLERRCEHDKEDECQLCVTVEKLRHFYLKLKKSEDDKFWE